MRTIELSNHPADALRLARQRRAGAGRDAAGRDEAVARHQLLIRRAANARDRARAQHRWLAWFRAAASVWRLRRIAPAPPGAPGQPGQPSDAEHILLAGIAGEQQVAAEFGQVLGDDWVLFRGYCNRKGEIDHLLLGPAGLVAIESKHLNASVRCDGDEWRFEKFDRYGNLVEQGSLGDKRGRSPSVQLNEPADLLESFLSERGGEVSMLRVVLLTHPASKIGSCRKPTVYIATSAAGLARELDDMPPVVGAGQRARLEELIARDHRYHEARRGGPAAGRRHDQGRPSGRAATRRTRA